MENYDIDTIVSLFRERGNVENFLVNGSEPDKFSTILDRFPIFEKYNCFSFSMNLKQGRSIRQLLKDNQYTEKFSAEDLTQVLTSKITPTSTFIIFFNIFSFLYCNDNNDQKKSDSSSQLFLENELTIEIFLLFMRCLISVTNIQFQKPLELNKKDGHTLSSSNSESNLTTGFYDRLIFFFFKKIFPISLHFFDENDTNSNEDQIKEAILLVLSFYDTQKRLPSTFYDMFISFIFKSKVHKFADQVLNLTLNMLKEKRPIVYNCDISKIIEYINPYLLVFNQRSLDIIVAIPKSYQTLSKSVIECFSNLSLSLINAILESSPKIIIEDESEVDVNVPYNVDDKNLNQNDKNFELIKEMSLNFIETESRFEKGFAYPQIPIFGVNWLLNKMDTKIIEIVGKLIISFMQSSDDFLDNFFNTFEAAISKINPIYYFDALTIFYHFATSFQNSGFISKYFDFILNPKLFNEKESIFTSLSEEKNAFRNAAFLILQDFPETISSFIVKSLNPLFRSELLIRIKNSTQFHSIISDVSNVCLSLRKLDMKFHCEAIEKARCCSFCFLSELFLDMFNSYDYFETVMQFCLEKNVTNIFINLYSESTITSRNFELLDKVIDFIDKILNVSLEISWKLIKITHSIFERKNYLVLQMKKFFVLIMDYVIKLKHTSINSDHFLLSGINDIKKRSFEAVQMSLKYVSLFNFVNSKYLHEITDNLSDHMSEELFMVMLEQMGKSPKFSNKIDCFLIKFPIFITICLFSCGFTSQTLSLFNSLCTFSIRNICYFHDQQIDSVLFQIIQRKKIVKYRNEVFENFYYDCSIPKEAIKDLLFKICSFKTDYRIVSQFLKGDSFIPFVSSLLKNYHDNNLPILSIPTMTAESRVFLNSSHFSNDFSISFWLIFDVNYLLSFPAENIDIITIQNGLYRFGIYIQGSKLRAYYANGTKRSDVTLAFFDTNKCTWSFISISYINAKKKIQTFYKELPLNKSEFDEIVFNDENPITVKINSQIQNRSYNQKNNNYYSYYSFEKNDFIGFIKDVSFYNRKLKNNEILNLFTRPNDNCNKTKSMFSLSNTSDFILNYQHSDNLFNSLRRGTVIIRLIKMLLKPNQKENICYCILNILSLLIDAIDIPFASLLMFVSDENHFNFKGTFYCFYSIFENIKSNQSSRIKFFNAFISNVPIWCNYSNFNNILLFYQTKLIIRNCDLLVNYSGLSVFLYYFELIDSKYWSDYILFLKRIFEKTIQKDGESDQIAILSCINKKYENIKEDYENLINDRQNLSSIVLEQTKLETSNITAFYPSIFQPESEMKNDESSIFKTKKTAEIHANKYASSSSRKEKKKSKESKMFDVVPKDKQIDILHDIPKEFKDNLMIQITKENITKQEKETTNDESINKSNNNNNNDNNNDDEDNTINEEEEDDDKDAVLPDEYRLYFIYMLDLIDFQNNLFLNNKDAINILFELLNLKDLQITKKVLITLYVISSEQPISLLTMISYNNINKEYFNSIFDFLIENLTEYPNFFPLTCALAFSIKPQPDCFPFLSAFNKLKLYKQQSNIDISESNTTTTMNTTSSNNFFSFLTNSNSNNNNNTNDDDNNSKGEFDTWYLFPIMLSFSLKEESLLLLFKILIQNTHKDKKTIERMIILYEILTNYYENRAVLANFFECLYDYYNEFIFDIIRYLGMTLFTHPYLSSNSYITLLHLINNESLISKSIEYEVGIHFYQDGQWDNSFLILLKLLDFVPYTENETNTQIILTLNSIFKSEIRSSNSFYEMSITCDQFVKDYKQLFEENFKEIFLNLRLIIQSNKISNRIENSESYRKIINDKNNSLEIINNQSEFLFKKRKRLSSQFDRCFRQMIYRNDEKLPKDIIVPEINCFLFNNSSESVTNIGIHYDQNGSKVQIVTPTSERYFDLLQDVNFAFKRKDDEIFEIFTKFGKKYRLQFFGKHHKKDIARNSLNSKLFDDIVKKWSLMEMTNFEFLMMLNAFTDNIHQDKAIFPSPLYKNKSIPDGKWSLIPFNNEDKKQFVVKTKRMSLMPNFRFNYTQTNKKRGVSMMNNNDNNSRRRKTIAFSKSSSKNKSKNSKSHKDKNNGDDLNNEIKSDNPSHKDNENSNDFSNNESSENHKINNNLNNNYNDSSTDDRKETDIDYLSINKEVAKICIENPVVPARYFYDFEIYNESNNEANIQKLNGNQNDDDDDDDDEKGQTQSRKNEFDLLYNMRKCIENCTNISEFADSYFGIQIRTSRRLIDHKINLNPIQGQSTSTIIFATPLNPISQPDYSSFIAINSDFYVKFFTSKEDSGEKKSSSNFLANLNPSEINSPKRTELHESSLSSFLATNNFLPSSLSSQSWSINESDSYSLDNVNKKSRLFQLDDGVAAFDPTKKILTIFTTSSIDAISTSPSHLSLTSLNPFYSRNLDSSILVPLIFSTSIPEVRCKTYATSMADSVNLMCGDSERQFYLVSPTVVYSNNTFFAQFSSEVKILKTSKNFNVVVAATEDGKVHIRSSTSGKKVTTINFNLSDDEEIAEIMITLNFGFIVIFMKSGNLFISTLNGTLIKDVIPEKRYQSEYIRFWFTFDTINGIDYIGFVTNDDKIFYFEAFYPKTLVQVTSSEKFKNVLAVSYDKFSKCFVILNNNCEMYVVSHNVLVVPINYNLI